jgi:hypothetical protein
LLDLEASGTPIVPTAWFERGSSVDLATCMAERGWHEAVVKPAISLSAHETWIATQASAAADTTRAQRIVEGSGLLVQPFVREVQVEGEWSFMYFDRVFSHAVIKLPASGDFRVQNDHGGTPSSELLEQASAVLKRVDGDLLYARVDGVVVDNQFLLMELEVIDPSLFLRHSGSAPASFARAIVSRLQRD